MRKWSVIGALTLLLFGLGPVLSRGLEADGGASPRSQQAAPTQPAPSPDALDQMLAPIALYPDQLIAQMLLCSTNPSKVGELHAWLKKNPALKGSELQEAVQKAGFEPSFVALSLFPQVVELMAGDVSWTTQLGRAFSSDRKAVFASIQRLRAQSREIGNLKSTPQQAVETRTTESGEQVIVIEPANPQVVYVPQYNPQTVYTQAPASTTVVVQDDDDSDAVVAGVVGFAAGVAIGAAIDNDYYYGPYGWHGGAYMYNDAWDDWYDDREDAREDWYENREDAREDLQESREGLSEERTERARTAQEQRTERTQARQENRPESQAQREQRRTEAQGAAQQRRTEAQGTSSQARSTSASSYESRGYSRNQTQTSASRSGTRSDAFSGYSSGRAERSASSRGQRSRSSGGGRGRRR